MKVGEYWSLVLEVVFYYYVVWLGFENFWRCLRVIRRFFFVKDEVFVEGGLGYVDGGCNRYYIVEGVESFGG